MEREMNMSVSPVCEKDGKRYAFVSFVDGEKVADGRIPDCKIISSVGFEQAEIEALETYMRRELTRLKQMAAGIRVLDAFMK